MTPLPLLLTAPLLLAVVSVRAQQERVTEERVREVVTWLASDERNGRDTGSRELEAASQWLAARFEEVAPVEYVDYGVSNSGNPTLAWVRIKYKV